MVEFLERLFLGGKKKEDEIKKAMPQGEHPFDQAAALSRIERPTAEDISVEEAFKMIGVGLGELQTLVAKDVLKPHRINGELYFKKADLLAVSPNATLEPGIPTEYGRPVKAAADLAVQQQSMDPKDVEAERSKLRNVHGKLFEIEQEAKTSIEQRFIELDCLHLNALFKTIDLSFLKWRRKSDGWPIFAFFAQTSPICKFSVWDDRGYRHDVEPRICIGTEYLHDVYYSDMLKKLQAIHKLSDNQYTKTIATAGFKGIIPDETRKKLHDVNRGKLFDEVIIVKEAPWRLTEEKFDPDPLIVGIKHERAWLIDVFDLTPTEDLVKREWTTGPTPQSRPSSGPGGYGYDPLMFSGDKEI